MTEAADADHAPPWTRPTIGALCRLDEGLSAQVSLRHNLGPAALWATTVVLLGGGVYGFVFGLWRAPEQALYSALKLPLLLLLIALVCGLINGLLALLLRAPIGLAQGLLCVLLAMGVTTSLLGALAPISLLFVQSLPGPDSGLPAAELHRIAELVLFFHIVVVGACGVVGNVHLHTLLCRLTGSRQLATRVLGTWLLVDGITGSQLSWILRPFLCKPGLEPQLIRPDALNGNFFEELWRILSPWWS